MHEEFVVARARAAAAGKSQPLLDALRSELTLAEEWVHREHELREMEAVRLLRHRAIWADGVTAVAPPREPGAPPGPARIVHPDAPAAWGGVPPVGAMAEKGASDAADAWPAALRAEVELALVRYAQDEAERLVSAAAGSGSGSGCAQWPALPRRHRARSPRCWTSESRSFQWPP